MLSNFDLNDLKQFSGTEEYYRHFLNRHLIYTEGVKYLAEKAECYWLLDEIAIILLPKLMKKYRDSFYCINFFVNEDQSAEISTDDGNNNIYFKHKITWTNFPVKEKLVKFYLCESGDAYCLMLPSEY